ncbi:hypothetical protein COOONC_03116 [Cooperia oncophora]
MKPGKAPGPDRRLPEIGVPHRAITGTWTRKRSRTSGRRQARIVLLSQPYKLFTKVVFEKQLNDYRPVEQAGFRKCFFCMNHIHAVTHLIERTKEYKQPLLL